MVQGCHVTTVHQVFSWFKPSLASMVHLLALYHHYSVIVELVLELYCETAKRILCYFTVTESRFLYENSLSLIRTYAGRQVGRRTVDKEAEEEQYRDLLLLMELLTNLLSKVRIFSHDSDLRSSIVHLYVYHQNPILPVFFIDQRSLPINFLFQSALFVN